MRRPVLITCAQGGQDHLIAALTHEACSASSGPSHPRRSHRSWLAATTAPGAARRASSSPRPASATGGWWVSSSSSTCGVRATSRASASRRR